MKELIDPYKRFFRVWANIKKRCLISKDPHYKSYGGRGITVCDRWLDFDNFAEDMYVSYAEYAYEHGQKRGDIMIERKDNNKGYFLENCTWTNAKEQNRNRRPSYKIYLEINGVNKPLSLWLKDYKTKRDAYNYRKSIGHSDVEALTIPIGKL